MIITQSLEIIKEKKNKLPVLNWRNYQCKMAHPFTVEK